MRKTIICPYAWISILVVCFCLDSTAQLARKTFTITHKIVVKNYRMSSINADSTSSPRFLEFMKGKTMEEVEAEVTKRNRSFLKTYHTNASMDFLLVNANLSDYKYNQTIYVADSTEKTYGFFQESREVLFGEATRHEVDIAWEATGNTQIVAGIPSHAYKSVQREPNDKKNARKRDVSHTAWMTEESILEVLKGELGPYPSGVKKAPSKVITISKVGPVISEMGAEVITFEKVNKVIDFTTWKDDEENNYEEEEDYYEEGSYAITIGENRYEIEENADEWVLLQAPDYDYAKSLKEKEVIAREGGVDTLSTYYSNRPIKLLLPGDDKLKAYYTNGVKHIWVSNLDLMPFDETSLEINTPQDWAVRTMEVALAKKDDAFERFVKMDKSKPNEWTGYRYFPNRNNYHITCKRHLLSSEERHFIIDFFYMLGAERVQPGKDFVSFFKEENGFNN